MHLNQDHAMHCGYGLLEKSDNQGNVSFPSMTEDTVKTGMFKGLCCKAQYTEKYTWNLQMEKEKIRVDYRYLSIVVSGKKGDAVKNKCVSVRTSLITIWSKNVVLWFGLPIRVFLLESVQSFRSLG